MKLAFVADAHLIADDDPYKGLHRTRAFFKRPWRSFAGLLDSLNAESPDMVIFLGDLVDWFSPENVDFALNLVSRLHAPWLMTPGNHDIAAPRVGLEEETYNLSPSETALRYWAQHDCDGRARQFGNGHMDVLLFSTAFQTLPPGTETWIEQSLREDRVNLVATHVPIDLPMIRQWIIASDPHRNLKKYVLSSAPDLYEQCLRGRVDHVFSGHLHLGGRLHHERTAFHHLNMAITTRDPDRQTDYIASATLVETDAQDVHVQPLLVRANE